MRPFSPSVPSILQQQNELKSTQLREGVNRAKHQVQPLPLSGFVSRHQESWLETTGSGRGTISFCCRVSSELDFDWLRFHIDGVLQAEQMDGRMGEHYYSQGRRENAEQKAERLVKEGLKKARWTE